MEIFEYLAAPCCCWLGVSMQSAGNGSVVVMYSYRCLMALYYLLLLGKVVCVNSNYQSGRCDNMNHINPVSRLVRIVRLGLLTFLPIFITTS